MHLPEPGGAPPEPEGDDAIVSWQRTGNVDAMSLKVGCGEVYGWMTKQGWLATRNGSIYT